MKTLNPLQFYVDKIDQGETFSLARYGDGELLCMWGKEGGNSNGCRYSSDLRQALLRTFEGSKFRDPSFIYGLQRVLPQDEERAIRAFGVDWHDTEVFSEAAANDGLDLFIEAVNLYPVTVIGNYSIRDATLKLMPNRWFMEVPPTNAYDVKDRIIDNILWEDRFTKVPKVYLFSCGMAANAIIGELHGQVKGWLIDVGHIWDPFAGSKSRCDLV